MPKRAARFRACFTGREAEAISQLVPPTQQLKATGFAANRQQASAPELANYRRLHFATHGLADNDNPALSAILLSLVDEQGRAQDGMLRLQDIYNLRLNAQLVVISACQTAIGKEVRGEGLLSLSRGFLYAGSQRVISTLWKVEDRATSELMSEFYQALLKPQTFSTAAALRLAQRKLLANPRWQAPRYWAAFIQQGDW
ncbi:MAG: CHAT domain-containing protein [Blastocatellia bacterium]